MERDNIEHKIAKIHFTLQNGTFYGILRTKNLSFTPIHPVLEFFSFPLGEYF